MVTNPIPTNLLQELGFDSVEDSWLVPVTSLKIVVEPSCGWYESTPNGVGLPVALS